MAPTQEENSGVAPAPNAQSQTNGDNASSGPSSTNAELAQTLRDLARGEQTANVLEVQLEKFESKLDEMLTAMGIDPASFSEEAWGPQKK